jgi:allantoicase
MDGWESRRKRDPGNDWCILRLGAPGRIRVLDIDTNHFLGNHPPEASVEGINLQENPQNEDNLVSADWQPILKRSSLEAGSQNIFEVDDNRTWTHLRLSIYPDGGVARFRAYGDVHSNWSTHSDDEALTGELQPNEVDLVASRNGGLALGCSNMFFSPMNNLILPGRATNMGGGWETRRKRDEGNDWMILRLGTPGKITFAEIDTNHFKGNFPDTCSLEWVHQPNATLDELLSPQTAWSPLLPQTKLAAHEQHRFRSEIISHEAITHVRVNIFPDGGISRLRLYGLRGEEG